MWMATYTAEFWSGCGSSGFDASDVQGPQEAKTLRWKNGKASVTDDPYAGDQSAVGRGILMLEARDLHHAIELMPKHPGVVKA